MIDTRFTTITPYFGDNPNHSEYETEPSLYLIIFSYYRKYFTHEESEEFAAKYIEEWLKIENEH